MNSCTRLCVVILLIYCITAIVESAPQLRVHLDKKHNFKQHCAALCERAGGHGEFVAKESLCKCSTKKPQVYLLPDIQARSAKKNTGTISMPLEFVRAKTLNKRQVQPDQGSNGEEQTKPVDPTSLVAENVVETSAERGKGQSDENSPTSRTWVDPETVKMQESKYLEMNVNNSTGTPEAKIEPMSVKCKQNATAQHAEKTRRRLDCTEINHPKSKDYQEYLKVTSSSKVPKPTEATTPDRIVGVAPVEMRNRKDDDGKVIYYPNTRGDRPKQVTSSSNITKPAAAENSEEIATATAEAATTIRSMERIAGLESLKMRNGGDNKDKVIHHPNTKKHDDRKIIKVTSSSKKEKPQPAEASGIETTTAEVEIATAEAATTIRSMERIAGSESLKMRNKRDDKDKVIHHPNTKMHEDRDIVKVTSSSKKKKPQPAEAGGIEITTAEAETVTVEVATTIRSMERVAGLESINMRNGVEDGIVGVAPVKDDGKVIYYPNTMGDRPKAVASSSKITKPAAEGNSEEITTAKVETATAEVATTIRSMERVAGLESLKMRHKRDDKDKVIHHPITKKHDDRSIVKVTSSSKKPQPAANGTESTSEEEVETATAEAATTIRSMERVAGLESLNLRSRRDDNKDKVIHHPNIKKHEDRKILKVTSSSKKEKPQPVEADGIETTTAQEETVTAEVSTTIRNMERVAGSESLKMSNGGDDRVVGVAPVKDDGKVIYYPNTRGDRPKAVASSSKITKPAAEGNSEEIATAKVETATAEVATTNRSMERVAGLESLKMRNKRDGKDTVIHHPNTKKHEDRKILKVTSSSKKEESQPGEASGTETTTAEVDLTTEVVTTATPAAKRQARSADSNQQEPITGQRAPGHRRTRPLHQRRQGIHQLTPHLPHHHAPHFPQHNPHFPQHTPHLPHLSQPGHIPHHPHLLQGHHSFPHLRSARPTHPIVASIRERIANLRSQRERSTSGPITGAARRTTESRFGKKTDTGSMNAQLREREKKRQIAKTQSGGAPRMDDVNNHGAAASTISAQNSNSRAGTQQNYQIITQPPNLVS